MTRIIWHFRLGRNQYFWQVSSRDSLIRSYWHISLIVAIVDNLSRLYDSLVIVLLWLMILESRMRIVLSDLKHFGLIFVLMYLWLITRHRRLLICITLHFLLWLFVHLLVSRWSLLVFIIHWSTVLFSFIDPWTCLSARWTCALLNTAFFLWTVLDLHFWILRRVFWVIASFEWSLI